MRARVGLALWWALALCPAGVEAATAGPPDLVRVYERVMPRSERALEARRVEVAAGLVAGAAPGLRIELPDGLVHLARLDGFERRSGGATWTGRLAGVPGPTRVVLTLAGGRVHGLVLAPEGEYELLAGPDGEQTIERLDPAAPAGCRAVPVPLGGGGGPAAAVLAGGGRDPGAGAASGSDPSGGVTSRPAITSPRVTAADAPDRVDLLVLYSDGAANQAGGGEAILGRIQHFVDLANTAAADSAMAVRFRLVHTAPAAVSDASMEGGLSWLRNNQRVAELRDLWGADLVALILGGRLQDFCGLAYVMRVPGPGFERFSFSVTHQLCSTSFAHELGHNLGFEHDPENSPAPPEQASYPWSYGHVVDGSLRTIMASSNTCNLGCEPVLNFSNPRVQVGGVSTGIDGERDNARTGDLTAPIVANFRQAVAGDGVFSDGFDAGEPVGWTRVRGDVRVVEPGLRGSAFALEVPVDGTPARSFLESGHPVREESLNVGFYLNPRRVDLGGVELTLLEFIGRGRPHLRLALRFERGRYRVALSARSSTGPFVEVGSARIRANAGDRLLVEWRRATAAGAADGVVRLRRNGRLVLEATDLDNRRWTVGKVRIGLPRGSAGAPPGGAFLIDAYDSTR